MKAVLTSLEDRAIEWFSSMVMVGWSITLIMPGEMLESSRFDVFAKIMGDTGWAMLFGIVGLTHLVVLIINGRSPKTPFFRVGCSVVGFIAFWGMAAALAAPLFQIDFEWSWHGLYVLALMQSRLGPGWVVYALLSAFSWFSIYRAMKDTRYIQPHFARAVGNGDHT